MSWEPVIVFVIFYSICIALAAILLGGILIIRDTIAFFQRKKMRIGLNRIEDEAKQCIAENPFLSKEINATKFTSIEFLRDISSEEETVLLNLLCLHLFSTLTPLGSAIPEAAFIGGWLQSRNLCTFTDAGKKVTSLIQWIIQHQEEEMSVFMERTKMGNDDPALFSDEWDKAVQCPYIAEDFSAESLNPEDLLNS